MNNYTAIIPVRKGSRRLNNKNIANFNGTTLLEYKIEQLKKVDKIDKIVVSSDCDFMLNLAEKKEVGIHKRSIEYCDEKTRTFGEVVCHICENVPGNNIIWATCTSPLVEPIDYENAIIKYEQIINEGYDSLMSVEELKRYLWDENGPINYELGIKHVPSQQLPPLYRVTDGILIAPRLKMIEWKYFHGVNPYRLKMSKRASVDIDDVYDMECAKSWLNIKE